MNDSTQLYICLSYIIKQESLGAYGTDDGLDPQIHFVSGVELAKSFFLLDHRAKCKYELFNHINLPF